MHTTSSWRPPLPACLWLGRTDTSWPASLGLDTSAFCSATIRRGQAPCPRSAHSYTCQMMISKGKPSNSIKTLSAQHPSHLPLDHFPCQTRQNPATSSWVWVTPPRLASWTASKTPSPPWFFQRLRLFWLPDHLQILPARVQGSCQQEEVDINVTLNPSGAILNQFPSSWRCLVHVESFYAQNFLFSFTSLL